MTFNPIRIGVAVGACVGLVQLAWSSLVASGWPQAVLAPQPLDVGLAAALVGVTAVMGFMFGLAFAVVWNDVQMYRA